MNLLRTDGDVLVPTQSHDYLTAEKLVLSGEYGKSIPFLNLSLKRNDADYNNTLLLSVRSYDQVGQPEKAILAAQELLLKKIDSVSELKARSLLLKNFSKAKIDISEHPEKNSLALLSQNSQGDSLVVLESLKWSMDFACDHFCVEEILYLKEVQLFYLYIIETDEVSFNRAQEMLKSRYEFFHGFLNKEHLDRYFRKKIAVVLLDAFKKLHALQLPSSSQGALRAELFLRSLASVEKNIETWLYQ